MDEMEYNAFIDDCESICFECGNPEPKHIISEGVALCEVCHEKENH